MDWLHENVSIRRISDFLVVDGGFWHFAVNLIEQYGLVPQQLCPESYSSSNTAEVNKLVAAKVSGARWKPTSMLKVPWRFVQLRQHSLELRKIYETTMPVLTGSAGMTEEAAAQIALRTCRTRKKAQLGEIYTILATCLGTPPTPRKAFSYDFYDKNGQYQSLKMTPLELVADLAPAFKPKDHLTLWHRPDLPSAQRFNLTYVTNVQKSTGLDVVNTSIEVMENAVVKMIKADQPV